MSTSFESIRSYIRSAVMDVDADCYIYSNDILNNQIRFTTLKLDDEAYNEVSSETMGDLTNKQKAILVLETAIHLISSSPDTFEHKTPVLHVKRKGGATALISSLQSKLDEISGGAFFIESDTDFDALIQGANRYLADLSRADSAYNGSN